MQCLALPIASQTLLFLFRNDPWFRAASGVASHAGCQLGLSWSPASGVSFPG